ncbi:hypothetical protein I204_06284 [Kwoniella mangroviensis CBS 8886]|nr:hypothetical protein I204_06284 [Kwoniella mangroviensis CBS 8886]
MSDPNDVWQDREGSPRRGDDGDRSPRRDRSRSPAVKSNGDRGRAEEGASQNQGNNLHISGLSRVVDEAKLREFFGTIGRPVVKAQIMLDPHSQESRGFGFVMLETGEDAQLAIEKLSGQPLEGKTVTIAHAKRGRARTPTPGRYHGVKVDSAPRSYGGGYDRPYQPRSYDSRYADRGPPRYDDRERRYDDRRYDDRRYDDRRYEERRSYRDDRDRRDDYYSRDAPRDAGERGGYREERPRYDDRQPRYDEP